MVSEGNRGPAGISLGRALTILPGIINDDLRDIVAIVDRIHGDGHLPAIPMMLVSSLVNQSAKPIDGAFLSDVDNDGNIHARAILIRFNASHRQIVGLHEIGHFLDACGLPGAGESSERHPALTPWRRAVVASDAFRTLTQLAHMSDADIGSRAAVLLEPGELWARSYAQFVAIRSGSELLKASLDAFRQRGEEDVYFPRQWDDNDFTAIVVAMEDLFRRLGWIA